MHEIVILSGKGGTGKTSIAASLATVAGNRIVMADCDVDAADLHLVLQPEINETFDFYSGFKAKIEQNVCNSCGKCYNVCRFDAIIKENHSYFVDSFACEGCGYCSYICPAKAIQMQETKVGQYFLSTLQTNGTMVHSHLDIGADNSGKLVAKVKREAKLFAEKNKLDAVLIDGPPGIGCPAISSLSGADLVVLVTEPTLSGWHDLQRIWELATTFPVKIVCIINKFDLNKTVTLQIKDFLKKNNIQHLHSFSYDHDFQKAITAGMSVVEYNSEKWKSTFQTIWNKINQILEEQ